LHAQYILIKPKTSKKAFSTHNILQDQLRGYTAQEIMILTRSLLQIQRVPKVASKLCRFSTVEIDDMKPHDHIYDDDDVEKVNEEYRGTIEIKSTTYGRGVFTLRDFVPGEFVVSFFTTKNLMSSKRDVHLPF